MVALSGAERHSLNVACDDGRTLGVLAGDGD